MERINTPMSEQTQTNSGDEFRTIKGQLQNKTNLHVINFQILIKDEYAISSFDESNFAKKLVEAENRAGNKNIKYAPLIKSAIEQYPGKKKEEIVEIVIKELKKSGANITKK